MTTLSWNATGVPKLQVGIIERDADQPIPCEIDDDAKARAIERILNIELESAYAHSDIPRAELVLELLAREPQCR